METRAAEIKVGLAVLAAFVVLVLGVIWGKGIKLRAERYPIVVHFQNIAGLERGALVLVNGVPKGKVTRITLAPDHVAVRCLVDKDVRILSDYRITIESVQLMAGAVVSINPGRAGRPMDTDLPLGGLPPMGISEVVGLIDEFSEDFKKVLANLNTVLIHLDEIVGDSANRVHLSRSLANLDRGSGDAAAWIAENKQSLTRSISHLESTLSSLDAVVAESEDKIGQTVARFDSASAQLQAVATDLHLLISDLRQGEGTLGRLATDPELYERMNSAVANLDSLVQRIRKRGLTTRIVLF
ncbi:MAG: MCE family protein [Calditrichaeota bacterium]|nr:MCE family protein [Calditrichota bacterium]